MLLRLTDRSAETVRKAIAKKVLTFPESLRRSLTWDRGRKMAQHREFTVETRCPVYFCDPQSPWQRGSNENTNGLIRHYMPKGIDLNFSQQAPRDSRLDDVMERRRAARAWASASR
jgi:IS30 family transposase